MEIWKDIKGYKGYYQVSNLGRVRSLDRLYNVRTKNQYIIFDTLKLCKGKILKQSTNKNGYHQVCLHKDRNKKNMLVHRLIAEAFIPNPDNKLTINHIDGNRANNSLDNLEWATMKEQQFHRNYILKHKSVINDYCREKQIEKQRRKVQREDGIIFNSITEAANGNESLRKHISNVCNGKRKTAGGYTWQYV